MKSLSREVGILNYRIPLKFDKQIGSNIAQVHVKSQRVRAILNANLATSRLFEILQYDVLSDIEAGPGLLPEQAGSMINVEAYEHDWLLHDSVLWSMLSAETLQNTVNLFKQRHVLLSNLYRCGAYPTISFAHVITITPN